MSLKSKSRHRIEVYRKSGATNRSSGSLVKVTEFDGLIYHLSSHEVQRDEGNRIVADYAVVTFPVDVKEKDILQCNGERYSVYDADDIHGLGKRYEILMKRLKAGENG